MKLGDEGYTGVIRQLALSLTPQTVFIQMKFAIDYTYEV